MSQDRKPVLKIPTSDLDEVMDDPSKMEWVVGIVGFDDPKELEPKQEGWSPSFMYAIKSNGVDHVLFASPTLHEKIQATGAIKDTVIRLGRTGEKTNTRWYAKYVNGPKREVEEDIPGFDEPVDQSDAPVYRQEIERKQTVNTPQLNSRLEYEPASADAMAMFTAMLTDINNVMMAADTIVRSNYPKQWDDLPVELKEDLISNRVSGNKISLENQLRALVGGWNNRSDYAAFNGLIQQASNVTDEQALFPDKDEEPEEEAFDVPDDDRWLTIKAININNPSTRSKNLAEAIAKESDLLNSANEAASIIKRFGYTSAGTDREVHWQIASMVWLYAGLIKEGSDKNFALKSVAAIFNHPEDLLDLFPEEEVEEQVTEEQVTELAEELGGQAVSQQEDSFGGEDELAF